jgi:hypothetical protein
LALVGILGKPSLAVAIPCFLAIEVILPIHGARIG